MLRLIKTHFMLGLLTRKLIWQWLFSIIIKFTSDFTQWLCASAFVSQPENRPSRSVWNDTFFQHFRRKTAEVGRLNTLVLDRELLRGVCERHNVLFQLIIWSREILEDSFRDLSSRPHREKHHACRKRSLDRHYLSDIRLLLVAGLLQWAVMNCWLCSETEINSPAVHHASVCSAHTSIISGDCLSDGSVYASTSCSPRPEVSGDLKIHEHKRRRSLEDTVSKPDGPWGLFAHLFAGGMERPAKLFLDEGKHICGTQFS